MIDILNKNFHGLLMAKNIPFADVLRQLSKSLGSTYETFSSKTEI